MPKRKFKEDDIEKIINFVKSNEILYNIRHKKFRNVEAKNRLWLQLANELNMDAELVKRKWQTMRDYFVRCKEKKPTGMPTSKSVRRWTSLSFLLKTSELSKHCISSLKGNELSDQETQLPMDCSSVVETHLNEVFNFPSETISDDYPCSPTPLSKKRRDSQMSGSASDLNEILREFLAHRPKPSDFMLQKPSDDIELFFDSMALTVRKFSPVAIARTKLKISKIVGDEELLWAEKLTAEGQPEHLKEEELNF